MKRMDNEGEDERRSHVSGREIVKGELQQEQVSSERAGSTSWWRGGGGWAHSRTLDHHPE